MYGTVLMLAYMPPLSETEQNVTKYYRQITFHEGELFFHFIH